MRLVGLRYSSSDFGELDDFGDLVKTAAHEIGNDLAHFIFIIAESVQGFLYDGEFGILHMHIPSSRSKLFPY